MNERQQKARTGIYFISFTMWWFGTCIHREMITAISIICITIISEISPLNVSYFLRIKYNYIIFSSLSFLQALPQYPSLLSFKFMASAFITCCHIHMCLYICAPNYINTPCLHEYVTCMMFSVMIIHYWINNGCALHQWRLFLPLCIL